MLSRVAREASVNFTSNLVTSTSALKIMFDHAPAAMLAVGLDARVLLVNKRAEAMFGWTQAELQGDSVGLLAPFDQREDFLQVLLSPTDASGNKAAGRTVGWRRGGQRMMLELDSSRIETDEASLVLTVLVDITDQLALECQLRAAVDQTNRCIGRVHHRVKNNLQTLCSLLDLQKARVSDPPSIDILNDSLSRMVSMALVHQATYGSPAEECVNFRRFMELLISRMRDTHGRGSSVVAVDLELADLRLGIDRAITCGLIVNELLATAFRQSIVSGAGIHVSLSSPGRATGSFRLSWHRPASLGRSSGEQAFSQQLVDLLVAQSGGSLRDHHPDKEYLDFVFSTQVDTDH